MRNRYPENQKKSFNQLCMCLATFLMFASAWFDTVYERATNINVVYVKLYRYSIVALVMVCLIQIIVYVVNEKKIHRVVLNMLFLFGYGVVLSYAMDLLNFRAMIIDNFSWIILFCAFFMHGKNGTAWDTFFKNLIILGTTIHCVLMIQNLRLHITGFDLTGGVISPLYYSLGFLGLILLVGSKKQKVLFSIVIGLMILFSTKRTGLFTFILGLVAYFVVNTAIAGKMKEKLVRYGRFLVVAAVGIVVAIIMIQRYNISIMDRLATISTDGGSGRDYIWTLVIQSFAKSDILHKVFGHGFHAVPELLHPFNRKIFAHNGFLEVLFDFGILGLLVMICGIIWMVVCTQRMIKRKLNFAAVMAYAMCIIIMFSIAAYLFEEARFIMPVSMICGLCIGRINKKEKKNGKIQINSI